MTPKPQEYVEKPSAPVPSLSGDSIVISGIAGLYPESNHVKEFSKILYDKINPITSENCRWTFKHPESSEFAGKIPQLDCFDAQFFKVTQNQASNMDATARKILEQSFQAIYDAGICPTDLIGKKVGVFVGASLVEMESSGQLYDVTSKSGLSITGGSKTMIANRISYWLDLKGPSLTYDGACTGAYTALQRARSAILSGECEAAIVGAINCISSPHNIIHYRRCIQIASDGKTKSFDENCDGCCKSDTISVMLLQKAKNALRVYAELIHTKVEFVSRLENEMGQMFGFIRNPAVTIDFLKQFYREVDVSPNAVEYVEAVGSATPEADKLELQAIEKIFCEKRKNPLLVGSVMSNAGFSDAAMGMTAITKVLLGYHTGKLASNLHCENPRKDIASLQNGMMKIVTDHEDFDQTYVAINGMSLTGNNAHVLLKGYTKPKDISKYKTSLPRLVTVSGRQETSVEKIFTELKSHPIDPEELALIHNIHSSYIFGHLGRGYIILDTDEQQNTRCLKEHAQHVDDAKRPLWFVYSGMGSQWAGMGTQLMAIPIFAAAIQKCQKILEPKGLNLIDIITSENESVFDNVLHSFVGIAAIQIGLTDVLTALGIKPDKIIGHSVGELGCAYADGCLTAEEMILFAYYRGIVSNQNISMRGAMAAVGIGYKAIKHMCPKEIDVACHNGPESCTISGPQDELREFVQKLKSSGVFAKEVPCSNIAYHSRYIAEAGPHLLKHLSKILNEPKLRSKKWLSTSVPDSKWKEAKYCSAEYMTNNLLSPVLFEEVCRNVPPNAVMIEIAPHGLLQAILKRSLSDDCKNIPLTKKNHENNVVFLLEAIGKMYIEGFNPKVEALYPKVEFPVSVGTPHLSHLVDWAHSEKWEMKKIGFCINEDTEIAAQCKYMISMHDDEHSYLRGNIVQGKTVYPFASAIVAVWETLAMFLSVPKNKMCLKFENVHFYSQPILNENNIMTLQVFIHRANGRFEVLERNSKVASGIVLNIDPKDLPYTQLETGSFNIDSDEIYNHLSIQGYSYRDEFQSILRMNNEEMKSQAQLKWKNNWMTLIDGLLQLNYLNSQKSGHWQPSQIRELLINAGDHINHVHTCADNTKFINAERNAIYDRTICGGISISNVIFRKMTVQETGNVAFKLYTPGSIDVNNNLSSDDAKTSKDLPSKSRIALKIGLPCNFETLSWENLPEPEAGRKVQVHFAGINMQDLKRATGMIPFNNQQCFGMDYSGLLESGDRVMGIVENGAASNMVVSHDDLTWKVPSHWTLEEAATVPLAYAQAYYYMFIKNELRPKSRVLIHGGAGALGQAAITLALANNCEVFTTVANNTKKQLLMQLFPALKENYIGCSRDASFSDMVLHATKGQGCNMILSCVQKDLKNESLKCAAFSGITVDIAQLQDLENYEYGMYYMTRQRSYMCVDFNSIFRPENYQEIIQLRKMINDGIASGVVRPLSRIVYPSNESAHAFSLLFGSKHCGRVLLRFDHPQTTITKRLVCESEKSNLIIYDGDSFGIHLANKLISRGAKKIQLHCLKMTKTQIQESLWTKQGVLVKTSYGDIDQNVVIDLLNATKRMGEIEGIYVVATKTDKNNNSISTIVKQLDMYSKKLCPSLKHFSVITVNNERELELYQSSNNMPFQLLYLPEFTKMNKELNINVEKSMWNQIAADVIDTAVCSSYPVLNARPEVIESIPLAEEIVKLLDDDKVKDYEQNVSLEDLKLKKELISLIATKIENKLHMTMNEQDILALNKEKLQKLETTTPTLKESRGLSVFLQHVESDEINATTDLYQLNTLAGSQKFLQNQWDFGDTFICLVPGIEGFSARFEGVCARLKVPALALQPGLDHPNENADQMATRFSKILLNKTQLKDKFLLLGYEFGISVALALAAILEDIGLTGTVFCLGNDPEVLAKEIVENTKEFRSEDELKLGIARHLFALMTNTEVKESSQYTSWEHFIYDVRKELGELGHSAQFIRLLIETAYSRIMIAKTPQNKTRALKSQIIHLKTKNIFNDSSLQKYSQQPIIAYDLDVSLANSIKDLRCASIINRHLPQDALNEFTKRNLCEKYFKSETLKSY